MVYITGDTHRSFGHIKNFCKNNNTSREKEHDLLMDIRNGVFLKDGNVTKEFWDMLDYYKEKFKHAAAHTKLPDEPNKKEIDKLLIDMYEMVL